MAEGQIRLKGAVEPGVVAELLQFLGGRQDRVGFLRVANRRMDGRIWYQDGAIVSAECGQARDLAAIRRLLCMKSGEFSFIDTNIVPTRSMFEDITSILLESYRQIDENKDGETDEPEDSAPYALSPDEPGARSSALHASPASVSAALPVLRLPSSAPADAPIRRPSVPWAAQGTRTPGQTLSLPEPLSTSTTTPSDAPATPPAPLARAPRPFLSTDRRPPPRRAIRPERVLLAVACVVVLSVCGLLFSRVADSRSRQNARILEDLESEAPQSASAERLFSWLPSLSRPPPSPAPSAWPAIRLSGLVAVPGQIGSAVINGRFVYEGQTVEGVLLDMVTRTGVVLRSGDQTRFVSDMTIGEQNRAAGTNAPAANTNAPFSSGFRRLWHRIFD
ncbi:MAG: DUF4388 domain-containing protein [bacterium]